MIQPLDEMTFSLRKNSGGALVVHILKPGGTIFIRLARRETWGTKWLFTCLGEHRIANWMQHHFPDASIEFNDHFSGEIEFAEAEAAKLRLLVG